MVLENKVLRKIFGPKGDEVGGSGENYKLRTFVVCSAHIILFECWNQEELDERGMWHVWGTLPTYQTRLHAHSRAKINHRLTFILAVNGKFVFFFSSSVKFEADRYALR